MYLGLFKNMLNCIVMYMYTFFIISLVIYSGDQNIITYEMRIFSINYWLLFPNSSHEPFSGSVVRSSARYFLWYYVKHSQACMCYENHIILYTFIIYFKKCLYRFKLVFVILSNIIASIYLLHINIHVLHTLMFNYQISNCCSWNS